MRIIPKKAAIHVDKEEGTSVDYFLFPEYEIHHNEIKPGVIQLWHHHPKIWETIFMIEGELEAHWQDELCNKQSIIVKKGDVVEVENSPHTFINSGKEVAKFLVYRFVPTGEDKREVIKQDKILDGHLQ